MSRARPEHCLIPLGSWGGFILPGRYGEPLQPPGFEEVSKEAWVALSGG